MPPPLLAPPTATRTYSVFLSSGGDTEELRDRVDAVFRVANDILVHRDTRLRLDVLRWEQHAPQRSQADVNTLFVAEAVKATMTVALLRSDIRPGTLEELTAVLTRTDRHVAVLWFNEPGEEPSASLAAFLKKWRQRLLYLKVGPPNEHASWFGIVRTLVDFLISMIHTEASAQREVYYELR